MRSVKSNTILKLPVMESFITIQGEGFHQGKAAYFIRLAGCDVGCHWCDTKDSWEAEQYGSLNISEIVSEAKKNAAEIAVITGGEPLMHNLDMLTEDLKKEGLKTHLETSGAYSLSGKWDWICFSPKKFKRPRPEISMYAHELKVVVYNRSDFQWAEDWTKEVAPECKLYLQPEWSKKEEILPLIIEHILENPKWKLSLQMHKYLNIR